MHDEAEQLIDEYLDEYRKMPAAQRAKMARSRKKPKTGAHKVGLKKRSKAARKPMARMKAKRYRTKMKHRG